MFSTSELGYALLFSINFVFKVKETCLAIAFIRHLCLSFQLALESPMKGNGTNATNRNRSYETLKFTRFIFS